MIRRVLAACAVLFVDSASPADASSLKCRYNQDCYNRASGGRLEDCFLDCNVCGGTRCVGLLATPAELDRLAAEPLKPLVRFDPESLGRAIDPAIANLYRWFWRWHDASPRSGARVLDLEGSVAIAGKPHDFALVVAQRGQVQLYQAAIADYGSVILAVHAPIDSKVELEYEFEPDGGGRARAGTMRFDAP